MDFFHDNIFIFYLHRDVVLDEGYIIIIIESFMRGLRMRGAGTARTIGPKGGAHPARHTPQLPNIPLRLPMHVKTKLKYSN